MEGLLLHLWSPVKPATRKRTPTMVPVTISRVKSQAGLDADWCLDTSSAAWCLGLNPARVLAGGAPPRRGILLIGIEWLGHIEKKSIGDFN